MNRRQFLCNVSATSITALNTHAWIYAATTQEKSNDSFSQLEGFIVSDAHFDWLNEQQPDPEEQRRAMAHILERFPNLDVFIDTGDAHHGNLRGRDGDIARKDWLDIIANGAGAIPFLYVPGNHEIEGNAEGDQEERCCRLGSLPCRPYYSFDLKGIHFVSVPEMMRAVYVTQETLEWLALDLRVHKDKTTILLSHNHILDTTGPFEAGYRGVVNSDALLQLFEKNPQVIAWMHGHNHNFELIKKNNVLYVSNGRIGGFDPSRHLPEGSHGLGGIYFSITESGLTVRSYSATHGCFLDERNQESLSAAIETKTSFSPDAPNAWSYGYGGARDHQRIPVKHHIVGASLTRSLYLCGTSTALFNDDPEFSLYTARHVDNPNKPLQQMLMGSEVRGNAEWQWDNPGITLLPPEKPDQHILFTIPKASDKQVKYYRCAPGETYLFRLHLKTETPGVTLRMHAVMNDTNGKEVHTFAQQDHELTAGQQVLTMPLHVPPLTETSIYSDMQNDVQTQLIVLVDISNLNAPLHLIRTELLFNDAADKTRNPGIRLNGKTYVVEDTLTETDTECVALDAKTNTCEVVECLAEGNRRMTWLIREEGAAFQVRNALAEMNEDWLEVGPIRAEWMEKQEIIIAPMNMYVKPRICRLTGITSARIRNTEDNTQIEVFDMAFENSAAVELKTDRAPQRVDGGAVLSFENGRAVIAVSKPDMTIVC